MLRQLQSAQAQMRQAQQDLEQQQTEVSVGGGALTAVFSGIPKLVSVRIDQQVAGDVEMLQDLMVAAVNEGLERVSAAAAERLGGVLGGFNLPPDLR